jgi:predicted nucleic acid-binding Zn ribbon protein
VRYDYKCETCEEVKEISLSLGSELPKAIVCDKCNTISMHRVWNDKAVHIPEWMRAGSEEQMKY